jgi:hypothetical protein
MDTVTPLRLIRHKDLKSPVGPKEKDYIYSGLYTVVGIRSAMTQTCTPRLYIYLIDCKSAQYCQHFHPLTAKIKAKGGGVSATCLGCQRFI